MGQCLSGASNAAEMSVLEEIDPKEEILLLKGNALQKFAMHEVYGSMTSHEILACLNEEYAKQQEDGPSQVKIMTDLGMFKATDFIRVKFEDLPRRKYTVWTYCWADSPWRPMWAGVKSKRRNADEDCYWLDIFCLDQNNPRKMETIKRSNEIYGYASKYFVLGLACFGRVWCCAELGCKDQDQIQLVSDFGDGFERENYLGRREEAYKDALANLTTDPKFDDCLCSKSDDRDLVRKRILEKFNSLESFDLQIKKVADDVLGEFRKDKGYKGDYWARYTFEAKDGKPDKCERCGKSEGLHHGIRRFCYDFLLRFDHQ